MDNQLLPPVDISTAPWPERHKLKPWHIATLTVGVPVIAFLSGVGANTIADHYINASSASPAATVSLSPAHSARPTPAPTPTYNLSGYRAVLNGTTAQAFVNALGKLRRDIRRSDFTSEATDTTTLINAAGTWLAELSATRPPPSYGANKLQYEVAAQTAAKAASTIQHGMATVNLPMI